MRIMRANLVVAKDGPHCITWTHAEEVNRELLASCRRLVAALTHGAPFRLFSLAMLNSLLSLPHSVQGMDTDRLAAFGI